MSGRKNILPPHKLIEAESLAADFESDPITITTATHLAITLETAGVTDNTGTFSVQYRVYKDDRESSEWINLTLTSVPTLEDADMTDLLDLRVPPGQVRVTFVASGSTPDGAVTCWVTGNMEG